MAMFFSCTLADDMIVQKVLSYILRTYNCLPLNSLYDTRKKTSKILTHQVVRGDHFLQELWQQALRLQVWVLIIEVKHKEWVNIWSS